MEYTELHVDCGDDQKDMLIAELAQCGFEGFVEDENGFSAFIPTSAWNNEILNEIWSFYEITQNQLRTQRIAPKNWNHEWEQAFPPIVAEDILIRAPFHHVNVDYPDQDYAHEVIIMPQMSFGTGHHATTRMVMGLMKSIDFKGKRVFDYGSGTGVLAILAMKLGAAYTFANDIDEWAAGNIEENLALNQTQGVEFRRGDISVANGPFQIILANITRNVLTDSLPKLRSMLTADGHLMMSGFLTEDVDDLCKAASAEGFNLKEQKQEGPWAALHFTV